MMVSAAVLPVGHSLCRRFQPAKLAFFFKKSGPSPAGCEKTVGFLTEIKEKPYPLRLNKFVESRVCIREQQGLRFPKFLSKFSKFLLFFGGLEEK